MAVKTPKEWQEERFQPLVEATTFYGNKVMIPQGYQCAWEMAELEVKFLMSKGKDPLEGTENRGGRRYNPYLVYMEAYEEPN